MQNQHTNTPLILGLVSSLTMAHAATWEKLPPLPEPAAGFVAGCVNGRIIVAGGTNWRDGTKRWLDTVWLFDPATNQWSIGPKLPHSVAYAAFASDGTRLYFAGGADGKQGRKEIYALDDQFKLTHLGDLPQPVVYGAGALRDGQLHIFGGTPDLDDWSKGSNRLYAIKLTTGTTTTLVALKELPNPVGIPAVTAIGSQLYTFTGAWVDASLQGHNVTEAFQHDVSSNTWKELTAYPEAIRGVFGVPLDDHRIYLAGGYGTDAEGFVAKAWIYDLPTNQYTPATPLPFSVNTTFMKCGDHIHMLGGEDQKKHRSDACWRIRTTELLGK